MRIKLLIISGFMLSASIGFMVGQIVLIRTQKPSSIVKQVIDRSLDKYTINNLSNYWNQNLIAQTTINKTKLIKDYPNFTSNEFIMDFNPNLDGKSMKKVSGLINIPKKTGKYPLLVMIRGYVPSDAYFIGNGTINGSIFFANHDFVTIAPDFLGYGESDKEADNVFEARFQTYTTVMALLKSIKDPAFANVAENQWDGKNIFVWAHSNGGQIALTTLEITGVDYPTVLWAPVSSSFPFSILYYTDEAQDNGKGLRRELAKFEEVYDTENYSLTNYLDHIKASIELNQGTADEAVPVSWSDSLAKTLKGQSEIKTIYNVYPNADHQMTPVWNSVINKDLEFFQGNLR